MRKEIRWFWAESKKWVESGLISEDQAVRLRGLYPEPKAGLPWSTIVFSGLGGAIAGLGIILLVAYNWAALHRFTKLGFIFAGILLFHGFGLRLFLRNQRWRDFGEALCLTGSMLFGAGIWLIAQVYHIDEHFPNGFLVWGLGALTLAWAMPSIAQGLLAVTVLCIWGCTEAWAFDHAIHWAPVLLFAGGGLLSWRLKSVVLLCANLAAFLLVICANVSVNHGSLVFRVLVSCSTAFAAVAAITERGTAFPKSSAAWRFFGWTGFLVCLYLASFPSIARDLLGWHELGPPNAAEAWFYQWFLLATGLACWAYVLWQSRPGRTTQREVENVEFESWLVPLTAVLCHVLALARFDDDKWVLAGPFNLVFLALAAAWMARGGRQGRLLPMVMGSLLLVALATARFFDLFESLAVRGLVFLLVGAVLAAEGVLFRRARRQLQTSPAQS
jgi:uncharacterized membrane protein